MTKINKDSNGNKINKADFYIKGIKEERTFLLRSNSEDDNYKLTNIMKENGISNIEISTDRFSFDKKETVILCDKFDVSLYASGIV